MIAALFVQSGGVYFGLPGVDPWDAQRDARLYSGPHPVVAHPPCERWGRYATGGPNPKARRRVVGDDDGCFKAALAAVRRWGGVLEHPAYSKAWGAFGLLTPPRGGGWTAADSLGGWTCHVEQGHYGHGARKATWLYVAGIPPERLPAIQWGPSRATGRIDEGFHSSSERRERRRAGQVPVERMSKRERAATPLPFRDLLIVIARKVPTDPAALDARLEGPEA